MFKFFGHQGNAKQNNSEIPPHTHQNRQDKKNSSGGNRTEALRASRKNGNRQPPEIGGWQDPLEYTRDLGGERLSGLKGRDLR